MIDSNTLATREIIQIGRKFSKLDALPFPLYIGVINEIFHSSGKELELTHPLYKSEITNFNSSLHSL